MAKDDDIGALIGAIAVGAGLGLLLSYLFGKKTCPVCNALVEPGSRYCEYCYTKLRWD